MMKLFKGRNTFYTIFKTFTFNQKLQVVRKQIEK